MVEIAGGVRTDTRNRPHRWRTLLAPRLLPRYRMTSPYDHEEPSRNAIDHLRGPAVIEFGADWCSHCQAAQPLIGAALDQHPEVQHFKIADGKGRPLGRSFGVKLWPTLVFLRDGEEVARIIRPTDEGPIARALDVIASN